MIMFVDYGWKIFRLFYVFVIYSDFIKRILCDLKVGLYVFDVLVLYCFLVLNMLVILFIIGS